MTHPEEFGPHGIRDFYADRVAAVAAAAAEGAFGRPMHMLASAEDEVTFGTREGFEKLVARRQPTDHAILSRNVYPPTPTDADRPTRQYVQRRLNTLRAEALEVLDGLTPTNDEEKERKTRWQQTLPDSLSDLINFELYKKYSIPTLKDTAPPKGATYEQLCKWRASQGWLSFCFGSGADQSGGYYDMPGDSELRLVPCPPGVVEYRRATILSDAADIADSLAQMVYGVSTHLNKSSYIELSPGYSPPIIGHGNERRPLTMDLLSGVAVAFKHGVWLTPDHARDAELQRNGGERFRLGPYRFTLRVLEDYDELRQRDRRTLCFPAHGLLWLMAGEIEGLRSGRQQLQEAGHKVVEESDLYRVRRLEGFDKEKLAMQRAIEQSDPRPDGGFNLDDEYNRAWFGRLNWVLGLSADLPGDMGLAINKAVLQSCRVEAGGSVRCGADALSGQLITIPNHPVGNVAEFAAEVTRRYGVIRLEKTKGVTGKFTFTTSGPEETYARLAASPIAEIAFGRQREAYASYLFHLAMQRLAA